MTENKDDQETWDEPLAQKIYAAAREVIDQSGRNFTFEAVAARADVAIEEVEKYSNDSKWQLVIFAYDQAIKNMVVVGKHEPLDDEVVRASFLRAVQVYFAERPILALATMSMFLEEYFDGKRGEQETVEQLTEYLDLARHESTDTAPPSV
ncbi:hypothetical protein [Streptomyces sp. NPDC047042]|uniref:hypothetical protein n=1 Tax=Streptomyces sp. NPDC047042 TaxID=3154807 RepID=UPI0033EB99F6